jgi:L-aminopeptidase/D-esterase-like protein
MVGRPLETKLLARNLITDVAGVRVGHADDSKLGSGATVVLFDQPAVAAADLARAKARCSIRR